MISGGAYGVSPFAGAVAWSRRATTRRIALALAGEITEYVGFPIPWVYAGDVAHASVVATRKGVAGERVPRVRPTAATSAACRTFCNADARACVTAVGTRASRWRPQVVAELRRPDRGGGPTPAWWRWPQALPAPFFVNDQTVERLACDLASACPDPA